jgi:adhesin transport system membrane fusion protein
MSTQRDLDRLVQEMKGRTPLRASALLITIFAVIGAVLVWAWLTEIDDVTRAPGRVVPAGDVQLVQAAEAGVIRAVFVEEGAIVGAGDPLVELDGLVQTSQLDR